MDAAAIVTIAGVGLIVAALAVYLITISYILVRVSFTLGTILIGVKAIANRCDPLNPIIGSILENVSTIQRELSDLSPAPEQEQEEEEEEEPAAAAAGSRRRRRARR